VTFALIHGGAHGAWCWTRLIAELERAGHRAVAMDLPCEDNDAGAADYARAVLGALPDDDEPIVVVAHSLGGLTAPLVPAARATRCLIFVSALLPEPGRTFRDQQEDEEIMFPYHGGFAGLRDRFFNRCKPADADWAMSRLRRQSETPFTETTPLAAWPDVPLAYVFSSDDRAVSPDWSRRAARERLAVEPVELVGADHSPFLSRPAELSATLVALANAA
jgi:pimeloyl-ACP methyl ester carboxylesterase